MSSRFRKLLYVMMALGGLAIAAYVVMSTPWFRRLLERRAIAAVENLTGGRVEVHDFGFRPLTLQIILNGFVLHGAEPSTAPPLFSARTIVVGLSPIALLHQQVTFRSLDWDNAEAHIKTNPDGSSNLPGPRISVHDSNLLSDILNLSIGRVTFLHTNIFFNDQNVPFDLAARDVAFQLRGDSLNHYQGSFSSSQAIVTGAQWSVPTTTLAAQFQFNRTSLTLDSLIWRSPGFNGNCSLKLQTLPSLQVAVNFSSNGDFPVLAHALRLRASGAGKVTLDGNATYRQGDWTSQGRVRARQIVIPSPSFNPGRIDVSADYSGERHRITISNLKISALSGVAQGTGEIALRGPMSAFAFHTDIHGVDMATTLQSFPGLHTVSTHLPPASTIQGKLSAAWQGGLNNFKSQFDLQFTPRNQSVAGSLPLRGHARGIGRIARGLNVDFTEVMIQTNHSSVEAHGTVGESDSNLSVQLASTDFEEWRPLAEFLVQSAEPIPLELKSQGTFAGTITGPLTSIDIRGRVEAGAFNYHGVAWDGFDGTVGATRSYAEISSGRLRRGTSELILDASVHLNDWQFARDAAAHFAAHAQHSSIEGLQTTLGISFPVRGDLTGEISIDGTLSNLTGAGQFQVDHGQIFQEPIDSLSAKLRIAGSVGNLDDIQLTKGSGRLTGHAQYGASERNFSVELHGINFSAADFKSLAQAEKLGSEVQEIEGGVTSFDLRGQGTPENAEINSTLDIRDVKMYGTPVGNLHGQVDWKEQRLKLQIASAGPGGAMHLAGEARTEGDWPIDLTGDYASFRADPWIRLLARSKFNARVIASGAVTVKGPLKDPGKLEIQSETKTLEVNVSDLAWTNGGPIDLHYAGKVLSARPFQMRGPSTNLEVEASLHFGNPPALSVTAHGESDNALLSLLDPALHATGRSELNLTVNGSPAQPLLHGTLKVKDLSLGYGDFPFHLSGLSGDIQLEGDRATATSLRGQVGGGFATLSGFLTFAETPRFDFQANLDQVRIQYPADFTSLLTGNLSLVGTTAGGRLEGDLTVRQMFASENFNVLALIGQVNAPGTIPASITASSLASKIRLDVRVSSDPEVRLETRDLRLVGDVDVTLEGTIESPVELGTIHVSSGEAILRENRYRLDRGDISMANPFRTQPVLDLQATTRVQRYDLTMDISGPFDQMKVAYRSDPPLPTADILSLLALGFVREPGELSTAGSERFSTVGATAILSQALSSQTTGRIQRLFGVSRIKIDPNVGGPANISGARVTVEQQVSRDFTLTYASNTGGTQQQVIQFEWAFSERVSMIGIRDQNGIFGMEFRFRRRFK